MKRFCAGVAVFLVFMAGCARGEISARAAIVLEEETGRVLYAHNADEKLALASTTKVMTALLALENAALDEKVTAGKNASGVPGTSIYLSEGETLTMEEMLYGLMLRSGNDAAVAIAEHIAGDVDSFASLMNARAAELGAEAFFTTPNGLDQGENGASARGLALICREALKNPDFRRIVGTKKKNIPWVDHDYMRVLSNKNRLLASYPGAIGIKTGYTKRAGRCLAFAAEREGMTVVGVVLKAPSWFDDAQKLMDDAFEAYHMETLLPGQTPVCSAEVAGAGGALIDLMPESALRVPLKKGERAAVEWEILPLKAPVSAGQVCGCARALVNGECLAETSLLACEDAAERSFLTALKAVMRRWPSVSER